VGEKPEDFIAKHVCAGSTNIEGTSKFGIAKDAVFGFWDWVGGRYSVSSAVGLLPLSLFYGSDVMNGFLAGMHSVDENLRTITQSSTNMGENTCVMLALIGFYNTYICGHNSRAILPYCQALHRFAAHVQQLDMESNGKTVSLAGERLPSGVDAGPIVFGEPGTNGQHSFYQLMHQGRTIPAEFIGFCKSQTPMDHKDEPVSNHDELMSNYFAQPDALALGKTIE